MISFVLPLSPIRINNRSKQSSNCSLLWDIMCLNKWMLAVSTWICHMATKARRIGAVCFVMGIRRRQCHIGCSQSYRGEYSNTPSWGRKISFPLSSPLSQSGSNCKMLPFYKWIFSLPLKCSEAPKVCYILWCSL